MENGAAHERRKAQQQRREKRVMTEGRFNKGGNIRIRAYPPS